MTSAQEKAILKKVERQLEGKNFAGYTVGELHHLTWGAFVDYNAGLLLIAIGKGRFQDELFSVMRLSASWHDYHEAKAKLLKEASFKER